MCLPELRTQGWGAFFLNLVVLFLGLRFSFQDPVVWGDFERICFWLVSFFFLFEETEVTARDYKDYIFSIS